MRKVLPIALSLIFISVLLSGCQSKENNSTKTPVNPSTESENNQKLSIENDFKSIKVSKTKGVDEITFDDKESINAFQNILSSAVREPGMVHMAAPEFYLEVIYDTKDHQSLFLWIGEKGQRSVFMKTEETHAIYTVSEEKTNQLITLVKFRFN